METPRPPLGLYIHIPFCRSKCAYCDFYSLAGREDRMDDYTAALAAHLTACAPLADGYAVDTVYFGGGTPSYLGPERLCALLARIRDRWPVVESAEITLEANPDSAGDPAALGALRAAGFNRISLGMQDAHGGALRRIGRVHTPEQVRQAVEAARRAGFENLSLDLIYGLPRESREHWRETLAAAADLRPEHLSCYGLKVEEGTPLFLRRETAGLPGDEAQAEMYLEAVDFLAGRGYRQYEISNFAWPGRESRHNLKYWTLGEYLGFGPGAHSDFGGVRFAYARDLEGYLRGVPDRAPPLSECGAVPPAERAGEWLMLRARTALGLDPDAFERRFRRSFSPFLPFLAQCREAGYAVEEAGCWRLTPRGFLVSNPIIGQLLDLLAEVPAE